MNLDKLNEYSKRIINYSYHTKQDKLFKRDLQNSIINFIQESVNLSLEKNNGFFSLGLMLFIATILKSSQKILNN